MRSPDIYFGMKKVQKAQTAKKLTRKKDLVLVWLDDQTNLAPSLSDIIVIKYRMYKLFRQ